jgi:hypothetical protein
VKPEPVVAELQEALDQEAELHEAELQDAELHEAGCATRKVFFILSPTPSEP